MTKSSKFIPAVLVGLGLCGSAFADESQYGMSLHDELITAATRIPACAMRGLPQ